MTTSRGSTREHGEKGSPATATTSSSTNLLSHRVVRPSSSFTWTAGAESVRSVAAAVWNYLVNIALSINCFVMVPFVSMLLGSTLWILFMRWAPWPALRVLGGIYLVHMLLWDQRHVQGQGWGLSPAWVEWFRRFPTYRWVAHYLPITLHKTTDLPPYQTTATKETTGSSTENDPEPPRCRKQAYLFLYHPHGVMTLGGACALMTNACDFDQLFPGLFRVSAMLNAVFKFPVWREWLLLFNHISANKDTLRRHLQQGTSVVLVPGGAAEALHAHPTTFQLVSHRLGALALALETGAHVVPCLGFGENQVFDTLRIVPSSPLYVWQQRLTKLLSFSLPVLLSPFPRRRPIHVVVGAPVAAPVSVTTSSGTTSSDPALLLQELHRQYWQAVRDLYETHKHQFGHEDIALELI